MDILNLAPFVNTEIQEEFHIYSELAFSNFDSLNFLDGTRLEQIKSASIA